MIHLPKSVKAWNQPGFRATLKHEVEQLPSGQLPLQQGLTSSSHALDDAISVMIISVSDDPAFIHAKVGVFFSGIIAGCNCADDPTPVDTQNEYCELQLTIAKATAETSVTLL
ncbi:MAG: hypothetical protein KKF85_16375 [Gammaproteobacteria bacterium]|nr:hypothetical protein [Rhodocyclaceae bacterium]MBU3910769.1 hypothetical protein [Gammaproteobacteria bacterium]MBU3990404.1 hypothetical protein [Gammaproteobacteria bacterium]MBU4006223.1 hypothetical protein [Gammaproteobacteria bacterium]MBU4097830.1 hypothetical protein [Gammaproteobacteria bacterium]